MIKWTQILTETNILSVKIVKTTSKCHHIFPATCVFLKGLARQKWSEQEQHLVQLVSWPNQYY